jgi:hypothetical protein
MKKIIFVVLALSMMITMIGCSNATTSITNPGGYLDDGMGTYIPTTEVKTSNGYIDGEMGSYISPTPISNQE